jgi:hypothetical protein
MMRNNLSICAVTGISVGILFGCTTLVFAESIKACSSFTRFQPIKNHKECLGSTTHVTFVVASSLFAFLAIPYDLKHPKTIFSAACLSTYLLGKKCLPEGGFKDGWISKTVSSIGFFLCFYQCKAVVNRVI